MHPFRAVTFCFGFVVTNDSQAAIILTRKASQKEVPTQPTLDCAASKVWLFFANLLEGGLRLSVVPRTWFPSRSCPLLSMAVEIPVELEGTIDHNNAFEWRA